MKKHEKLSLIKERDLGAFIATRSLVFSDFSKRQNLFCCCGRLATSLHEMNCSRFNEKVDSEVIRRLSYLLTKKIVRK